MSRAPPTGPTNRALWFGAGRFSVLGAVTVCRVLSSIPGLYLLDAGDNQNYLQTLAGVPTGLLRTTGLYKLAREDAFSEQKQIAKQDPAGSI